MIIFPVLLRTNCPITEGAQGSTLPAPPDRFTPFSPGYAARRSLGGVLRTALTPRWLVWLVVVLGLGAGFVWLGLWQMNVAREDAAAEVLREAAARPVLELTATIEPHAAFPADGSNQRVQAVGRFEPARQVLVADRRLAGADGFWVVQPFVVQETG